MLVPAVLAALALPFEVSANGICEGAETRDIPLLEELSGALLQSEYLYFFELIQDFDLVDVDEVPQIVRQFADEAPSGFDSCVVLGVEYYSEVFFSEFIALTRDADIQLYLVWHVAELNGLWTIRNLFITSSFNEAFLSWR